MRGVGFVAAATFFTADNLFLMYPMTFQIPRKRHRFRRDGSGHSLCLASSCPSRGKILDFEEVEKSV